MFSIPVCLYHDGDVESEMRGIEWGRLFETYHNQPYDPVEAGSGT